MGTGPYEVYRPVPFEQPTLYTEIPLDSSQYCKTLEPIEKCGTKAMIDYCIFLTRPAVNIAVNKIDI